MRAERTLSENIDPPSEAFTKRSFKRNKVQKGSAFFHFDEQVDVARLPLSAARKRSEYPDVLRSVFSGFSKDDLPGPDQRIGVRANSAMPTERYAPCHCSHRIAQGASTRHLYNQALRQIGWQMLFTVYNTGPVRIQIGIVIEPRRNEVER